MEGTDTSMRLARAFGRVAAEYELGRPGWPREVVERVARRLELDAEASVVDLAAGTGKLTRRLDERFADVVAVEPDDEMRALLERSLPGVAAYPGTAEEMPLSDGSADAVFVADAFHWFDAPAALREIARVLRRGGGLVLLWNNWNGTAFEPPLSEELLQRMRAVYARSGRPGGSRYLSREWLHAFPDSPFLPPEHETVARDVVLTADEVASLWLSVSSVAALPDHERHQLESELRSVLAGTYRLPMTADLYWTRLR